MQHNGHCDLLTEMVIYCNNTGEILFANQAAQRWSDSMLVGQSFSSFIIPEVAIKGQRFFKEACAAIYPTPTKSWELIVGDSDRHTVATFRGYRQDNNIIMVAQVEHETTSTVQHQISELTASLVEEQRELHRQKYHLMKQTEAQIQAYQHEIGYQKLALDEHCIVCIISKTGKITYVNNKLCEISQYSFSELLDQDVRILNATIYPKAFYRKIYRHIVRGRVWHGELYNRKKDGFVYVLNATIVPFLDSNNKPYQYVLICTDITELKQAKELDHDRTLVLEMIARDQALTDILNQITLMMKHQHPESVCLILLLYQGSYHYMAGCGLSQDVENSLASLPISFGSCVAGKTSYPSQPITVRDIPNDPMCSHCHVLLQKYGLRFCCPVPVVSREGDMLGIITLFFRTSRSMSAIDTHLITTASHLTAIAAEQRLLAEKVEHQAYHDAVTGLPNRLLFEDRLSQALAHAQQHHHMVAVFCIDLNRFRNVTNTLNHATGDDLIQLVAKRFETCVDKEDTLAHIGDDEFALVLPEVDNLQDAVRQAKKLIDSLRTPFRLEERDLFVTASLGVSIYPTDGHDAATLQRNANIALSRAKGKTGNTFQCYAHDMHTAALKQIEMEAHLHQAIEHNELSLHYQPQVDMYGKLVGAEALLRWNNAFMGEISPGRFIPLAERSGLIVPIGAWVINEACRQAHAWQQADYHPFKVAINVSVAQFTGLDFVEMVHQSLQEHDLDPCWLELEVTESLTMHKHEFIACQLDRLRSLGIKIAIDDFGTGYSSLSYLQQLPIDTLKIDRSFIRHIDPNDPKPSNDIAIVKAVIMLSHSLNMEVLTEGVETPEQFALLHHAECDYIQGNLVSSPLSAHAFEATLAELNHHGIWTTMVEASAPTVATALPTKKSENGIIVA